MGKARGGREAAARTRTTPNKGVKASKTANGKPPAKKKESGKQATAKAAPSAGSTESVGLGLGYLELRARTPAETGVVYFMEGKADPQLVTLPYTVDQDVNSSTYMVKPGAAKALTITAAPHSAEALQRLALPLQGQTFQHVGSVVCGDYFGKAGFMTNTFFRLREQGGEGEAPFYICLDDSIKYIYAYQHAMAAYPFAAPPAEGGPADSSFSDWCGDAELVGVNRVVQGADGKVTVGAARLRELYEPDGTATQLLKKFLGMVRGLGFPIQVPIQMQLYPFVS